MVRDVRHMPDVELHQALVVDLVDKMMRSGQCARWSFDEMYTVGLAEAWVVLDQYYDPERGTVSTLLCRVLPSRIRRVYQAEFEIKRDWVYRERSLDAMASRDELTDGRDGPIDELVDAESRALNCRRVRGLHDLAWQNLDPGRARMVCGLLRGRTQAAVGREYGVSRTCVATSKREFVEAMTMAAECICDGCGIGDTRRVKAKEMR